MFNTVNYFKQSENGSNTFVVKDMVSSADLATQSSVTSNDKFMNFRSGQMVQISYAAMVTWIQSIAGGQTYIITPFDGLVDGTQVTAAPIYAKLALAFADSKYNILQTTSTTEVAASTLTNAANFINLKGAASLNMGAFGFNFASPVNLRSLTIAGEKGCSIACTSSLFTNTNSDSNILIDGQVTFAITSTGTLAFAGPARVYGATFQLPSNSTQKLAFTNADTVVEDASLIGGGASCDTAVTSGGGKYNNLRYSGTFAPNALLYDGNAGDIVDNMSIDTASNVTLNLGGSVSNLRSVGAGTTDVDVIASNTKLSKLLNVNDLTIAAHDSVDIEGSTIDGALALTGSATNLKVSDSYVGGNTSLAVGSSSARICNSDLNGDLDILASNANVVNTSVGGDLNSGTGTPSTGGASMHLTDVTAGGNVSIAGANCMASVLAMNGSLSLIGGGFIGSSILVSTTLSVPSNGNTASDLNVAGVTTIDGNSNVLSGTFANITINGDNNVINGVTGTVTDNGTGNKVNGLPLTGFGSHHLIQSVSDATFTLVAYTGYAGTLLGVGQRASGIGTAGTFAISIDGVDVTGLTAVVPSTGGSYTASSAANTFARGARIQITYSGTTAVLNHGVSLDVRQSS